MSRGEFQEDQSAKSCHLENSGRPWKNFEKLRESRPRAIPYTVAPRFNDHSESLTHLQTRPIFATEDQHLIRHLHGFVEGICGPGEFCVLLIGLRTDTGGGGGGGGQGRPESRWQVTPKYMVGRVSRRSPINGPRGSVFADPQLQRKLESWSSRASFSYATKVASQEIRGIRSRILGTGC